MPIILTIRGKIIIKTELVKVSPNETIPLSDGRRACPTAVSDDRQAGGRALFINLWYWLFHLLGDSDKSRVG